MNTKLIEHPEQPEDSPFKPFQPLNQMGHSPSRFPLQALPGWLRDYVKAVAEAVQAPVDFVATMSLGVIAIAVQRHYRVRVTPDWKEIPSDFFLGILPSGAGKSPVFRYLLEPLREYERKYNECSDDKKRRLELEADLKGLQTQLDAETDHEELAVLENSIQHLKCELNKVLAVSLRFTVQDATVEKAFDMLREQRGCLAWVSDEGSEVFSLMLGRYNPKDGSKYDGLLRAWSGDVVEVDRFVREGGQVFAPALSMMLAVQPSVLENLGDKTIQRLVSRGLLPRFLFSAPKSRPGGRNPNPTSVPKVIRDTFASNMRTLISQSFVDGVEPIELHLSPDADRVRGELVADTNEVTGEGGEMEHFADFLHKFDRHLIRLAAMLFAAEHQGRQTEIDGATAQHARALIDYFKVQAEVVFESVELNPEKRSALKVFGFITRWSTRDDLGRLTVSRADIYQRARKSYKPVERLDAPLRLLVNRGYIRELPKTHGNSSPLYEVNPKAL